MTPMRQRMLDELRRRNYSEKTVTLYVAAVARFAAHFKRCPSTLGADEIRAWQMHLRDDRKLAWATYNVHVDRKSTRLNSSHVSESRMPSSA